MDDYQFRIRFSVAGDHVHCRLFSQKCGVVSDYQLLGQFVVRRGGEFKSLVRSFQGTQFIPDWESLGMAAAMEVNYVEGTE